MVLTIGDKVYEVKFNFLLANNSILDESRIFVVDKALTTESRVLTTMRQKTFKNILGKEGNVLTNIFPLWIMFLAFLQQIYMCEPFFHLQMLSIWTSL